MALKITVRNQETGAVSAFELPGSQVRIGRNGLNELTFEEGFVSQFHGVVRETPDGIHYQDLGSTNGSTLDGRRLGKNVDARLTRESDLRIGPLRLEIEALAARPEPAPARQATGRHHTVAMFGLPRPGEGSARAGSGA